jgi:acetyl-CoA synthetase
MSFKISSFEEYLLDYQKSIENPEAFWSDIASHFIWKKPWEKVLNWNFEKPEIEWFKGAKLNITENMLDRHLENHGNKPAIIWERNNPEKNGRSYSYRQLYQEVCQFANALKKQGIGKGDRVCLYLPMVPELAIATLACARVGAIHSIIFAGFSASAMADRMNDAKAKMLITSSGMERGNKQIALKEIADEALYKCNTVEKVIVLQYGIEKAAMKKGRDIWWHEAILGMETECPAEEMDAEDTLFILYTSGSTGKPKGVVHTCGGYMVYTAYTFQNVFQYSDEDTYWCTADIGWVTGHSYILYGPLLSGATSLMFEGIPTFPDPGRFWQICEKYQVNQFYTAPTAIRSLMTHSTDFVNRYNLSSLKILGSVGEPINEEAWNWYHEHVGKGKCPIVDTWWQTETGGIMISGLGSLSPVKPAHAGLPLPGIQPVLLDQNGKEIKENEKEGYLCIRFPWPGMLRTTYGDHERCRLTYFSTYKGYYFTGDGAKRNKDGLYRIIGRVDDVINVSGHRFGTAEIEDALNSNEFVVESAVVGYPHPLKGQAIYAFVVCNSKSLGNTENEEVKTSVIQTVSSMIGKIAKPDKIQIVSGLPKTRSGKIMRRILRKIAEGDTTNLGDTSTLLDPEIVNVIMEGANQE